MGKGFLNLLSIYFLFFTGQFIGDTQYIFISYALTVPGLFLIAYTPSCEKLSSDLPNASFLQISNFLFIFGFNFLVGIGFIIMYYVIRNDSNYDKNKEGFDNGEYKKSGQFNTIVFLANNYWNVLIIMLCFVSEPFKKFFVYNIPLLIFVLFNLIWIILMIFVEKSRPSSFKLLEISKSIQGKLFGITTGIYIIMIILYFIEKKIITKKTNSDLKKNFFKEISYKE